MTSTAMNSYKKHVGLFIYSQKITMCPHGYHHNGFMATPALGMQDVRFYLFIYLYIYYGLEKLHG